MRLLRWNRNAIYVVLASLLVVAVATVLITPDPTDDVHGVVHSQRSLTPPAVAIAAVVLLNLVPTSKVDDTDSAELSTPDLLQLICICRC